MFFRVQIDQRPAYFMSSIVVHSIVVGKVRNALNPRVPTDWAAADDPKCINSWRLALYMIAPALELPDSSKCWKSSTYDGWDVGTRYCFLGSDSVPRAERYTKIMAIVGLGAPFTEYVEGRKFKIEDLPKDSVLLIEVTQTKVPWMQAGDVPLSEVEAARDRNETLGAGISEYGRWVAFADSTVWLLSKDMPIAALLPFCTVDGAEKHDRERELREYVVWEYEPEN
jgi:hypothetical protein